MIKIPAWLSDKIVELGMQVVADEISHQDAAEELAGKIRADNGVVLMQILSDWSKNKIKVWIANKSRDHSQEREVAGQPRLPFEELPPHLEIAPGRLAHQNVMTGRDWDNALAIWKNRMVEAENSYKRFLRCYDAIRPLLTGDVTTADVAGQIGGDEDGETGQIQS
jgi:hypothetical protein